jgi:hypothetical protein
VCWIVNYVICSLITLNDQRGIHDIEHQITYEGSNFIFHDSQGFESGAKDEIETVWDFIWKRSGATKLEDQLHAIWYLGVFPLPK